MLKNQGFSEFLKVYKLLQFAKITDAWYDDSSTNQVETDEKDTEELC